MGVLSMRALLVRVIYRIVRHPSRERGSSLLGAGQLAGVRLAPSKSKDSGLDPKVGADLGVPIQSKKIQSKKYTYIYTHIYIHMYMYP